MKFFDLKDISERYMDLLNPSTPEKMLKIGEVGGLAPGQRVIDFGCGFGEVLVLWAERFGISGVGIDVRPYACERARRRVAERGLADRIEIACGNAAEYPFAPGRVGLWRPASGHRSSGAAGARRFRRCAALSAPAAGS